VSNPANTLPNAPCQVKDRQTRMTNVCVISLVMSRQLVLSDDVVQECSVHGGVVYWTKNGPLRYAPDRRRQHRVGITNTNSLLSPPRIMRYKISNCAVTNDQIMRLNCRIMR
jgi:hypothetical protein